MAAVTDKNVPQVIGSNAPRHRAVSNHMVLLQGIMKIHRHGLKGIQQDSIIRLREHIGSTCPCRSTILVPIDVHANSFSESKALILIIQYV